VFDTTANAEVFEVIIVNDGTKDGSMSVVRQFANHPNMTIIEQENQGLSAARMNGLTVAKGDYVWFVDGDDWLVEDGVSQVLGMLEDKSEAEVLMFPIQWAHEDSSKSFIDYRVKTEQVVSKGDVIRVLHLPTWLVPRFVIKHSLFDNQQLFFPIGLIHEDVFFGSVLACIASVIHVLPFPVYSYRIRPGSIRTSHNIRSAYDLVSIHKMLITFMKENLPAEDWPWFKTRCIIQLMECYTTQSSHFGSSEYNRFLRQNRSYVWKQWKDAYPSIALKKRIGRFFFFYAPAFYTKLYLPCLRKFSFGRS
jgi:glycosyltransferase involved in cell wall biosynthesis